MTLDEFEALKMCAGEERRCAVPDLELPALQGISKDLGFGMVAMRQTRLRPSASFLDPGDSRI